jgi:putative flippase GtrA
MNRNVSPNPSREPAAAGRFQALSRYRSISRKALVFGLIGIINTAVDYAVFLAARAIFQHWPQAVAAFGMVSENCHCASSDTILLITANTVSWLIAVSGSYVLNSSITFAAESGRRLNWRTYLTFLVSGIAGWLSNTATLLIVAKVLMLPVWLAKVFAIGASFVVNFSFSHFIVFRVRPQPKTGAGGV